jgi:hypothetical protein
MKRVGLFVVAACVILAIGLSAVGGTQVIKLFGSTPLEIDGSQPCYLAHGWLELDSNLPEGVKPRDYLIENITFELLINTDTISPNNYVVQRVPESQNTYDEGAWRITWYYRFPPRDFADATYQFVGIWHYPGGPSEGLSFSRDVTVIYP